MKKLLAIIVSAMLLSGCMTANMLEAERVPPATATPALWNGATCSHFTAKAKKEIRNERPYFSQTGFDH